MISPVLAQYKLPEIQTDSVHANIMMQNHGSMGMMSKSDDDAYMIQGVPSDHMLHEAISSLLLRMGWKYVQVNLCFCINSIQLMSFMIFISYSP